MRKILTALVAAGALSCWSFALTKNAEEQQEHKAEQAEKADQGASNTNGSVSITSGPNVVPEETSATITWQTSGQAGTVVKYGTSAGDLSQKAAQPGGERNHRVTLRNLQPGTTYYFAIMTDHNTVRQQGQFQTKGTAVCCEVFSRPEKSRR